MTSPLTPRLPAGAWPDPSKRPIGFKAMTTEDLPLVAEVEKTAHAHPWNLRHFQDSLNAGHLAQMLVSEPAPGKATAVETQAPILPDGRCLLGYCIAMKGVDEVHLLNITTVPAHRRQGWARLMLDALATWTRGQGAHWLWLEVRASNQAARTLYERQGFQAMGWRKGYYPDHGAQREDAVVMSWQLDACAREEAA